MKVPYITPYLQRSDLEAVLLTMIDQRPAPGQRVAEFEAAFAAKVGARSAVSTATLTGAAHLAILALDQPSPKLLCSPALHPAWMKAAMLADATLIPVPYMDEQALAWPGQVESMPDHDAIIYPMHLEITD